MQVTFQVKCENDQLLRILAPGEQHHVFLNTPNPSLSNTLLGNFIPIFIFMIHETTIMRIPMEGSNSKLELMY